MAKVSDTIMESLLHCEPEVAGKEMILNLIAASKSIVFVANHRGGLDHALMPYALRRAGLASVADSLVFAGFPTCPESVLEQSIVFPSVFELPLRATLHSLVQSSSDPDWQESVIARDNGKRVAKRVDRKHHLVLFPEEHPNTAGLQMCTERIAQLLYRDNFQFEALNPRNVVVVPVGTFGAEPVFQTPIQESVRALGNIPYSVRFGPALALSDLQSVFGAQVLEPNGNSHLLGQMIAEMLPPEKKGVYGNPEASSVPLSAQKQISLAKKILDNLAIHRISEGAARPL
jgi:hypothetical protein